MSEENIQKVAQLWCKDEHMNKQMDANLCADVAKLLDEKDLRIQELISELQTVGLERDTEILRGRKVEQNLEDVIEKHESGKCEKDIEILTQERDGLQATLKRAHEVFAVESDQIGAIVKRLESERDGLQVNLNWFNVEEFKKMEDDLAEKDKFCVEKHELLLKFQTKNKELSSRLSLMQNLLQEMKDNDNVMNWTATSWREIYLERIITILSSVAVEPTESKECPTSPDFRHNNSILTTGICANCGFKPAGVVEQKEKL